MAASAGVSSRGLPGVFSLFRSHFAKDICKRCSDCRIHTYPSTGHRNNITRLAARRVPHVLRESHRLAPSCHLRRYCTQESKEPHGQASAKVNPFSIVQPELNAICDNIKQELKSGHPSIEELAGYHFDGQGKAFRPMVIMLVARACNFHSGTNTGELLASQKHVAEIAEMIHVASLVHDDVIDDADKRRGVPSVQAAWSPRQAIMTGVYILSVACMKLARIRNDVVVEVLSQVLEDLVRGEFMQLGSEEGEDERFAHYLRKTYKKTASLVACSCKSVAILGQLSEDLSELAFQYGRNLGIAFQLVDDLLDFISTESLMGKPAAADLKLGLATGPVLFAAQKYPELNAMILRRFSQPGDVDLAWDYVNKSDGIEQTRYLAEQHCREAVRLIKQLRPSMEQEALINLTQMVLNRLK